MTGVLIIYLFLGLLSLLRVLRHILKHPPQAIIVIALWHVLISPLWRLDRWFYGGILRGWGRRIEAPIRWAVSIK